MEESGGAPVPKVCVSLYTQSPPALILQRHLLLELVISESSPIGCYTQQASQNMHTHTHELASIHTYSHKFTHTHSHTHTHTHTHTFTDTHTQYVTLAG